MVILKIQMSNERNKMNSTLSKKKYFIKFNFENKI